MAILEYIDAFEEQVVASLINPATRAFVLWGDPSAMDIGPASRVVIGGVPSGVQI